MNSDMQRHYYILLVNAHTHSTIKTLLRIFLDVIIIIIYNIYYLTNCINNKTICCKCIKCLQLKYA